MKNLLSKLKELKEIIAVLCFFLAAIGITAKGFIDKRIDVKLNPVVDVLEFQNFLMMESLPDSVVTRAIRRYTNKQKGSVKK